MISSPSVCLEIVFRFNLLRFRAKKGQFRVRIFFCPTVFMYFRNVDRRPLGIWCCKMFGWVLRRQSPAKTIFPPNPRLIPNPFPWSRQALYQWNLGMKKTAPNFIFPVATIALTCSGLRKWKYLEDYLLFPLNINDKRLKIVPIQSQKRLTVQFWSKLV